METSKHPGIGRALYLLLTIMPPVFAVAAAMLYARWTPYLLPETMELWQLMLWVYGLPAVGMLVLIIAVFLPMIWRLRNLGMSAWWFLAHFVPILDLWLIWRMTACPVGYADHKQLDLAGKTITTVMVLLVTLPILVHVVQTVLRMLAAG